jgi:SanA protein
MTFCLRTILVLAVAAVFGVPLILLACNLLVERAAAGRTFDTAEKVPANKVGVVMGCSRYLSNGNQNVYFTYRIRAAVELYNAKKVKYLIVSGDNGVAEYNEPDTMKMALIEEGVPSDRIICDYAGFRTLDTVVRAKKVFLEDAFTIISQRSHNQRGVFLAQFYGIKAVAYNASRVSVRRGLKTKIREIFARTKAVLDVYILNTQPKFLGETISIGG